jgi:HlyD family secretion protein
MLSTFRNHNRMGETADGSFEMTAKKRSGWGKWIILLLLVGGGVAGWIWYAQKPNDTNADYKSATIAHGDITQSVTANGQLSAVKNVTVGSQVSGIITALGADFNSQVTNGQVVAQIDPSTYVQNLTQTEAELANSKAGLELAELNMRRATELRTNELIAVSEYDKTLVELHQAQAVVKIREAAVKKAKVDLERTTIYAPIDGVVISRAVDVGQTVAASFNAPTLFNIANDLRNMRIEAMISEADVGGVQEGQRVTFTVDAYFGRTFRGEVTQVRFAPVTNQNVVSYTAVVDVNNDELKLRPGMTANASIITAQKRDVLKVPNGALRFRPPETAVVIGLTNASAAGGGTNRMEGRRGSGGPGGGSEGGERPNREEMRKRFESMSPEEREEMRRRRAERSGGGGGGGGADSGRSRGGSESSTRTVYLLEKDASSGREKTVLRAVSVKVGIADATHTEILEGLKEGDVVVAGLNVTTPQANTTGPSRGPMGSPFGGGGFRPR